MSSNYQNEFNKFLMEVKMIPEARDATYNLSSEYENVIVLSGEIVGKETNQKINKIGEQLGLLVIADELSVVFKPSEIESRQK